MVQSFPFIISGIAKLSGVLQAGITISIKNNTKDQTGMWVTNTVGEYAASLSDPVQFSNGYDVGDSITVSCGFASQTIAVPAGAGTTVGGETVDLISAGVGWRKLQYLSEPPTAEQFNKLKCASEPPVVGAWNKLLYSDE